MIAQLEGGLESAEKKQTKRLNIESLSATWREENYARY